MQASAQKQMVTVETVREAIAAKMDTAAFTSWICPTEIEIYDNTLCLTAQNRFSADFINSTYKNILSDVANEFGLNVQICVRASRAPIANDNNVQSFTPAATTDVQTSDSFESFVISDDNAFVVSACKKLAAGTASFSPLFIYGVPGCGKSLLVRCINSAAPGRTIMMSGGQFVSEFTRSLHDRTVFAFKDYCRNCDTFIMDDVQTLAGKRATCDEFLQLIIDLRAMGKNIVLTANAAPNNLSGFDRRMQSLLASGLVADIVAPNANVRRVILMRAGVASDVAGAIAENISSNGHLISGVAMKIKTYSELMGTPVDMNVANRLLSDCLQKSHTPINMVKMMCEKLGVSYDAVCGRGRGRAVVFARQVMMTVLHNVTNMSLSEIGRVVGDRDHATVLYAISQIEKQQASDLVLSAQIAQLSAECK